MRGYFVYTVIVRTTMHVRIECRYFVLKLNVVKKIIKVEILDHILKDYFILINRILFFQIPASWKMSFKENSFNIILNNVSKCRRSKKRAYLN